ncbi:MAG: rRNA maturation RNase YbeY [Sphingobacteriaceae bacterium]|nr:rRNA maturation RNase YbeY [Sphingobacteriaceae bacterium]
MIRFYSADTAIPLKDRNAHKLWLMAVAESRGIEIDDLSYVFCSDDYLLDMNKRFLNHDYYTDIITFPLAEDQAKVNAECYLSVDRIRENAHQNEVTFATELRRVMVHGLLHLIGEDDKSEDTAAKMRAAEGEALIRWLFHVEQDKQKIK